MNISKNSESSIVFIHGWGMNPNFWTPLDNLLSPKHKTQSIDLGFTDQDLDFTQTKTIHQPDYIIAHSLGGLYALKRGIKPNKGAIFINSFYDFTQFAAPETLTTMQQALQSNCAVQMKRFLRQSDCLPYSDKNAPWNTNNLYAGLDALKNWQSKDTILEWKNSDLPFLILAGTTDKICPIEKTKLHWDGFPLYIHEQAGHALPNTHTHWCYEQIESFIRSHDNARTSKQD